MLEDLQVYNASLKVHGFFLHLVMFNLSQTYVRGTVDTRLLSSQSECFRDQDVVISTM
jgi:hypothetical protein